MFDTYPENRFDTMISELKFFKETDRNILICILGGERLAQKIDLFLQAHGISIDAFLVDRQYFNNGFTAINGRPVYCTEDYVVKNDCVVIVGYRGYKQGWIQSIENNRVKKEYCLDFIGRLVLTEEIDRPYTEQFCNENVESIKWLEDNLADEKSIQALKAFIYQRIYGNYEKEFDEVQYFPSDLISFEDKEIFVDCGAFHGETILELCKILNEKGLNWDKIIAFEPDPENADVMSKKLKFLHGVKVVQSGVWEMPGVLCMQGGAGSNSYICEEGDIKVSVNSIDAVLDGDKATYIKMDIEGSELAALKGARNTIIKYKPKLAVCIYHKRSDIIEIPKYIKSLNNSYKLYVRNHSANGIETVLYAV